MKRDYRSKQPPHVNRNYLEFAELFDLSGFQTVEPDPSFIQTHKSSNANSLLDPDWS